MSTLYDDILRDGFFVGEHAVHPRACLEDSRIFQRALHGSIVVRCDNVTRYFYEGTDKEVWPWSDFPNVAPPWPRFFIETTAPALIVSEQFGIRKWKDDKDRPRRWGALVVALRLDGERPPRPVDADDNLARFLGLGVSSGAKWCLWMSCVLEIRPGRILAADQLGLIVRGDGHIDDTCPVASMTSPFMHHAIGGSSPDNTRSLYDPLLLAISFAHCRNVEMLDQTPPRHERRYAEKNGLPAPVTYKILDISAMQGVLRSEGKSESEGLQRALHICRGHFAHYDEKPLFGKVQGTFWIPDHVRGSAGAGIIVKDYRVRPS